MESLQTSIPLTLRLPSSHHRKSLRSRVALSKCAIPSQPRPSPLISLSIPPPNTLRTKPVLSPSTSARKLTVHCNCEAGSSTARPVAFKNRFLDFARLGSVIGDAAEGFFKSEIRCRLFVTAVLIVISRVGYFVPLPGFDRRLIPENYLSFAAGSMDELGDVTAELKLSLFQLGISPQIAASILMQE